MAYAFADAVNRRDAAAFESLWDENGVWEIGAPLHSSANGPANIAAHMIALAEPLEFFVQQVHGGVVANRWRPCDGAMVGPGDWSHSQQWTVQQPRVL